MDYKKHYLALCKSRQGMERDCKTDSHHIIPVSMGGTDDESNLVDLTRKEHYVAHKLLWKSNPTEKAETWALSLLFNCVRKWKTTFIHPKFEKVYMDAHSYWNTGMHHPFAGETKETHAGIASMSEKMTGKTPTQAMLDGYKVQTVARTGRTKENHAGTAAQSVKMTGRTKEDHSGVAAQAAKISGRNHHYYDPNIYHFRNVKTGKVAISDRYGMKEMYGLNLQALFAAKPPKTCKGWQLLSI